MLKNDISLYNLPFIFAFAEQLKKSASSPNIPGQLTACTNVLSNAAPFVCNEEDTTHQNAGILMVGYGHAMHLHNELQDQPGVSTDEERTHDFDTSGQHISNESCDSCQQMQGVNIHGQASPIEQGYRHPPPYTDLVQQKSKLSLDKYRHPPPYRETKNAHLSFNDLYSGQISSEERNDLIYQLMTNKNPLQDGYSQSQPCLPSSSYLQDIKGVKIDKETMTDSYLYPEGKTPENVNSFVSNLYGSHATVMSDPHGYNISQGLPLQNDSVATRYSPEQSIASSNLYAASGNAMATSCPAFYTRSCNIPDNQSCTGYSPYQQG